MNRYLSEIYEIDVSRVTRHDAREPDVCFGGCVISTRVSINMQYGAVRGYIARDAIVWCEMY